MLSIKARVANKQPKLRDGYKTPPFDSCGRKKTCLFLDLTIKKTQYFSGFLGVLKVLFVACLLAHSSTDPVVGFHV